MRNSVNFQVLSAVLMVVCLPVWAGPPNIETFTYQGRLDDVGAPVTGEYDFEFTLWDAYSLGSLVEGPLSRGNVDVVNGLFTVGLDFDASVFDGQDLFLEIGVREGASTGAYTTLVPRQTMSSSPYSIFAASSGGFTLPQDLTVDTNLHALQITNTGSGSGSAGRFEIDNAASSGKALVASTNGTGHALQGYTSGDGGNAGYFNVASFSSSSEAVLAETYGQGPAGSFEVKIYSNNSAAVRGTTPCPTGKAVEGEASSTLDGIHYGGYFRAYGKDGRGVYGRSSGEEGYGVYGTTSSGSGNCAGVYGETYSKDGCGVKGYADDGDNAYGVYGQAVAGGTGVYGTATGNGTCGVHGESNSYDGCGVRGTTHSYYGKGVYGEATSENKDAVSYGGYFIGHSYGVYGEALGEEEEQKYGGYFVANGFEGVAVRGLAMAYAGAIGKKSYGGQFEAASSAGVGVLGRNMSCYFGGAGVQAECGGAGGVALYAKANYPCITAGGFDGSVSISGDLTVTGSKSFVQAHPKDETRQIVYVCLEGGENGVYVRGSGQLSDGVVEITLPEHFGLVASSDGLTAQVTARGDCMGLYVENVEPGQLMVRECQGGKSGVSFDYLVMGVRLGKEQHEVIRDALSDISRGY